MDRRYDALAVAAELARSYLDGLADRPVGASATLAELRAALGGPLPEQGEDGSELVRRLAADVEPGLIASAGPRFFGFVIGGALPPAVAADWLVSAWDQNNGGYVAAPALSVVEEVAGGWLREVLGLPPECSLAFVTGCQMAHFTCLAAARRRVLLDQGWDVDADGLRGSPPLRVIAGAQVHVTFQVACRMLGLGFDAVELVAADGQGRMRPDALAEALAAGGGAPAIVCAQAGEINTGAFDPLDAIVDLCREHGAWCHVDGAFGLYAAASPAKRHLLAGHDRADSWATDAHKWLNVPYDCGIAAVRDRAVHRAAMTSTSPYIPPHEEGTPWGFDWNPEFSRRARGVPVYAALRALGRDGLAALVDRCCDHAVRFAERLGAAEGVEVLNDVVLNQVIVRFAGDDAVTADVIARTQEDGTCWLSGSTFGGRTVMRISIVGWNTTAQDVDRSADAILAAFAAAA